MTAAVRDADPTAAVASCPGWTAADLVAHLTAVHRWARAALDGTDAPPYDEQPATADDYAAAAGALVERLRALPADAPCWTFSSADRTAAFWRRRQLHEVTIHHWDLAQQQLRDEVAADGVSEVVDLFLPRMIKRGAAVLPPGQLVLTDGTRSWQVGNAPGPEAVVTADAPTLNLLVWGRRTLDDTAAVTGDAAFAAAVLAAALTP